MAARRVLGKSKMLLVLGAHFAAVLMLGRVVAGALAAEPSEALNGAIPAQSISTTNSGRTTPRTLRRTTAQQQGERVLQQLPLDNCSPLSFFTFETTFQLGDPTLMSRIENLLASSTPSSTHSTKVLGDILDLVISTFNEEGVCVLSEDYNGGRWANNATMVNGTTGVAFEIHGLYKGCDPEGAFQVWSSSSNSSSNNLGDGTSGEAPIVVSKKEQSSSEECLPIPLESFQETVAARLEAYVDSAICEALRSSFQNTIVLVATPTDDALGGQEVPPEQLLMLGDVFVETFNAFMAPTTEGCDRYLRVLQNASVSLLAPDTFGGRRRHLQQQNTNPDGVPVAAPSEAPSSSPTSLFVPGQQFQLLLTVSGTCQGCEASTNLFDQTINGVRSLQQEELAAPAASCSCPVNATRTVLLEADFFVALNENIELLIQQEGAEFSFLPSSVGFVQQIQEVPCAVVPPPAAEEAATTTNNAGVTPQTTYLLMNGVDATVDLVFVADQIMTTYNDMNSWRVDGGTQYCDPLAREILQVEPIMVDFYLLTNQALFEITLVCNGVCDNGTGIASQLGYWNLFDSSDAKGSLRRQRRGLSGSQAYVDDDSSRRLEMVFFEDQCFCPLATDATGIPRLNFEVALIDNVPAVTTFQVLEVQAVNCSGQGDPSVSFTDDVVIEVVLNAGSAAISNQEIASIELAILSVYNRLMETSYCDPLFRTLDVATITDEGTQYGSRLPLSVSVRALCRGCLEGTSIYGSGSDAAAGAVLRRQLQLETFSSDGTTCFCNADSVAYDAPTESEFMKALGAELEMLNLPNVASTGNCGESSTFQSLVLLTFEGRESDVPEEDRAYLVELFMSTYNLVNTGQETCDPLFRNIENATISTSTNITIESRRNLQTVGANPSLGLSSDPPSFAPSSVPSQLYGTFSILTNVAGMCVGCASDTNLFDNVSLRRMLGMSGTSLDDVPGFYRDVITRSLQEVVTPDADPTSCFCPFDEPRALLTGDSFAVAYELAIEEAQVTLGLLTGVVGIDSVTELDESGRAPLITPSLAPSPVPSDFPTAFPSGFPSDFPSEFPSQFPSDYPSALPSPQPTQSLAPSMAPTCVGVCPLAGAPNNWFFISCKLDKLLCGKWFVKGCGSPCAQSQCQASGGTYIYYGGSMPYTCEYSVP